MQSDFTLVRHADAGDRLEMAANHVAEIRLAEEMAEVEVVFPDGRVASHPTFRRSDGSLAVRLSSHVPGLLRYDSGKIEIASVEADDGPLRHGPLRVVGRHFEHADGTPFFWLADSWWFGHCRRLRFPGEFDRLARDRADKGFSVIQLTAGLACDIPPLDPRDENEAGHAWTPGFERLNASYFDAFDRRIVRLVELGLVPNLVGMWGYYLPTMGLERVTRHWRELVARYAAFPIVWTLCGEARLVTYGLTGAEAQAARDEQRRGWAEVGRRIRGMDAFARPMSVHPGPPPGGQNLPPIEDESLLDFGLLQPGHGEGDTMFKIADQLLASRTVCPDRPTLVGEAVFEGMHGSAGAKTQRNAFWAALLNGAPGHSYGADAIWQMNRPGDLFGPSPLGHVWGNATWQEAMHWQGSNDIGVGRRILQTLPWTKLEPRPDAVNPRPAFPSTRGAYAAELPGDRWLLYVPFLLPPWGSSVTLTALREGRRYRQTHIDPTSGERHPMPDLLGGPAVPLSPPPVLHDWVVLIEPARVVAAHAPVALHEV